MSAKIPTLTDDPKISQDGFNVILTCQAEAIPTPTALWTRDEKEIKEGEEYKFHLKQQGGDKYVVKCEILNFSKVLAGVYKCILKNDHGQSAATFTVTAGDAPEFVEKPHIIQREGGAVLVIKVRVKSKTEPKTIWLKGTEPVKPTDRVTVENKKDEKEPNHYIYQLVFKGPVKDDEAKYTCTVSNEEGSSSQSLNLMFD